MKNAIEMTVATLFCALLTVNVALAGEADTTMPDCQNWTTRDFWTGASTSDVQRCFDRGPIGLEARDAADRTPLHLAATYGAAETIGVLIQAGADIDIGNQQGRTPLYWATLVNSAEIVQALIQAGANVNLGDDFGQTPLHNAVSRLDNTESVEALIQAGADVNVVNDFGQTPLYGATISRNTEIVEILIQAGADATTAILDCHDWIDDRFWEIANAEDVERCFDDGPIDPNIRVGQGAIPLLYAAYYDAATEVVEALIRAGADINAEEHSGRTSLHIAAESNNIETVETLIQAGAIVNIGDNSGRTPLYFAQMKNNTEIVEALIQAGADTSGTVMLDCQDWRREKFWDVANASDVERCYDDWLIDVEADILSYWTPLHRAAQYSSDIETVEALIQAGANVNAQDFDDWTPLHRAAQYSNNTEIVEALILAGANVNARNEDGWTPLHVAAHDGNAEIVRVLIRSDADVSIGNNSGQTPLFFARTRDNTEIIQMLVEADTGASDTVTLNCQDWTTKEFWETSNTDDVSRCFDNGPVNLEARDSRNRRTPLHYAASYGTTESIEILVEAGADVNTSQSHGWMSLHYAASSNSAAVVELLVQAGADVNAQSQDRKTPLHNAAERNSAAVVDMLIQADADVDAQTRSGLTPLHSAVKFNNIETVEALILADADVSIEDDSGQTPLHNAASNRATESVIEMLIQAGANVNTRNNSLQTPLHEAVSQNYAETVAALTRAGAQIDIHNSDGLTPLNLAEDSSRHITAILTQSNLLHLSILPTSRSVLTGQPANVFATAINGGNAIRMNCGIRLNNAPESLEFRYFLTDEQNRIIGEANSMVTLDPGAKQSYLIELISQTALDSIELFPTFACSEQTPSNPISFLNSVTLSVGATPTLDIIAMASTTSNDGVLRGIPGEPLAFGVASSNLGAAGQVSVQARAIGAGASAADMLICQTDPTTGNCLAGAPEERAIANLAAGEVSTWTVLLVDSVQVPFNPVENRIMVEFFDDAGVRRGGTSVALSLMENRQ